MPYFNNSNCTGKQHGSAERAAMQERIARHWKNGLRGRKLLDEIVKEGPVDLDQLTTVIAQLEAKSPD